MVAHYPPTQAATRVTRSWLVTVLPGNTTARFTIGGVSTEQALTASIPAGAVSDAFGNPGAAFSAVYQVDIGTVPYPAPLVAKTPLGSLVYDPDISGLINFAGDVDNFTLNIDPGQTISIIVTSTSGGLQPRVELFDPSSSSLGFAQATGLVAGIQTRATTSGGLYRIAVSGGSGTVGDYTVQVILNSAFELEGLLAGATNNTIATAQNINGSFLNLDTSLAHAQRGAVLGEVSAAATSNLISNGGFETGNFTGWTVSGPWQINNGTLDPAGPATPKAPIAGSFDAVSTPTGPSTKSLTQSFVVPSTVSSAILTWSDRIQNFATAFQDPNHEYRVQVLDNVGNLVQTVYSTNPGDPLIQLGPNSRTADLTALLQSRAGQTMRLRFEEQDSLFFFNVSVDDISLAVSSGPADQDFYAFDLAAGDKVSLGIEALTGSGVTVELRNSVGVLLSSALGGPTNFDRVIDRFPVSAAGTYYARVTGSATASYNLFVTRNAVFDAEGNNTLSTAQDVTGTQGALGDFQVSASTSSTLNRTDSGWWNSVGSHTATNDNYLVGQAGGTQYRDYFVFDMSSVTQTITGATLRLYNPGLANGDSGNGYVGVDPNETYTVFDVSTPLAALQATGSGQIGIFNDLGTGLSFGSATVSPADNGQVVSISLNSAAIAALNAAAGGSIGLGGALTSIVGSANQLFFAFSGFGANVANHVRQLVLTYAAPQADADWYKVTLAPGETALEVQTNTPADGPGEFVNVLNPKIQLLNASGVEITPSVSILADGRNEKFRAAGLIPGATYYVKVTAEGGTTGEYFLGITPLRTPTVTTKVDDGLPSTWGPDGSFTVRNPVGNGWSNVVDPDSYLGDYTIHADDVNEGLGNFAIWNVKVTSGNPELFVTWKALPGNATNATYQVYRGATLLNTIVVDQTKAPNDALLFGTTLAESLGTYASLGATFLSIRLLTNGANGSVVADGAFDPPAVEIEWFDNPAAPTATQSDFSRSAAMGSPVAARSAFGMDAALSAAFAQFDSNIRPAFLGTQLVRGAPHSTVTAPAIPAKSEAGSRFVPFAPAAKNQATPFSKTIAGSDLWPQWFDENGEE